MARTSEDIDFIDEQRRDLEATEKRLERVLTKARRVEGDELAAHDKELQDAKDLLRRAQRETAQLESGPDEVVARDRRGLQHLMSELTQVLEAVEVRLDTSDVSRAPDAQRHQAPRL